ncbi:MAG: DUF4129 domain-containing protein [Bacteroidota bacterium]
MLVVPLLTYAQVDYEDEYPQNSFDDYQERELVHPQDIEESGWMDKASSISYSEEKIKKKEKKEKSTKNEWEKPDWDFSWLKDWWAGLGLAFKVLCIAALAALVMFIVYRLTKLEGNTSFSVNRSLEEQLNEVEETLEETELERLLREALESANFKLAIRLYFLMMLQKLDERNWIDYKKQKTNFLYLREMKNRSEYSRFRELTHAFEYSWYGEVQLDQQLFAQVESAFRRFLNEISN